jgi:hypothetical protein
VTDNNQHPLVRRFVCNAERKGAATYAGESFAVARWEDGKRVEIKVDRRCVRERSQGR